MAGSGMYVDRRDSEFLDFTAWVRLHSFVPKDRPKTRPHISLTVFGACCTRSVEATPEGVPRVEANLHSNPSQWPGTGS